MSKRVSINDIKRIKAIGEKKVLALKDSVGI